MRGTLWFDLARYADSQGLGQVTQTAPPSFKANNNVEVAPIRFPTNFRTNM